MSLIIIILYVVIFIHRMITIIIGIINAKNLIKSGGSEHAKVSSVLLIISAAVCYAGAMHEAVLYRKPQLDIITYIGIGIYIFSMIMLYWVMFTLKEKWTIKVIIMPNHEINNSFLFKVFRHPNYLLNFLPELLGIILISKAWITLASAYPFFVFTIIFRIICEEKLLKKYRK